MTEQAEMVVNDDQSGLKCQYFNFIDGFVGADPCLSVGRHVDLEQYNTDPVHLSQSGYEAYALAMLAFCDDASVLPRPRLESCVPEYQRRTPGRQRRVRPPPP